MVAIGSTDDVGDDVVNGSVFPLPHLTISRRTRWLAVEVCAHRRCGVARLQIAEELNGNAGMVRRRPGRWHALCDAGTNTRNMPHNTHTAASMTQHASHWSQTAHTGECCINHEQQLRVITKESVRQD